MLWQAAYRTVPCEHTWKTARTDRPLVGFRTVPWLDCAPVRASDPLVMHKVAVTKL
jgi:hypothetical protein